MLRRIPFGTRECHHPALIRAAEASAKRAAATATGFCNAGVGLDRLDLLGCKMSVSKLLGCKTGNKIACCKLANSKCKVGCKTGLRLRDSETPKFAGCKLAGSMFKMCCKTGLGLRVTLAGCKLASSTFKVGCKTGLRLRRLRDTIAGCKLASSKFKVGCKTGLRLRDLRGRKCGYKTASKREAVRRGSSVGYKNEFNPEVGPHGEVVLMSCKAGAGAEDEGADGCGTAITTGGNGECTDCSGVAITTGGNGHKWPSKSSYHSKSESASAMKTPGP